MSAADTMASLAASDPHFGYRQVGIVTKSGEIEAHSGDDCSDWKGHVVGDGCLAMGNVLAGPETVEAMASAFEAAADKPFEERLMLAIEAGRDKGGQADAGGHLTERSAGLLVYGWDSDGYPDLADLNVRIDAHPTAVAELRRQYEMIRHLTAYQHMKANDPANLPKTDVWEADHMTEVKPPPWYD
jgi:uncharacterized Ntn-hydrolase superfamily protein